MPSPTDITPAQLVRLVGLPNAPAVIDVRTAEDYAADPRLLPTACRRDALTVERWAPDFAGQRVVVVSDRGNSLSQGVVAWLRNAGIDAENLEGGFTAWRDVGGLLIRGDRVIGAADGDRSVWVTRARPKVDRIACPWLIRRFVDRNAVFLFVTAAEVGAVADRFKAMPFDIEGVRYSHRGDRCTFDTMLDEFGLSSPALDRLATIVRGADTARLDLAPEAPGFLAACLGLSRSYRDDLEQLAAGLQLCDAFYRWSRDAVDETHDGQTGGHPRS